MAVAKINTREVNMYKSLTSIAKMFDVSPAFIKKHFFNDLQEGVHFIYVGTVKRFNVKEMEKLLVSFRKPKPPDNPILERFLI